MKDIDRVLGYVTIKVPVEKVSDHGTFENPPETWVEYGEAELISHDLKDADLAWLGHEIETGDVCANFQFPPKIRELADDAQERYDATTPYPQNLFDTGQAP